MAINIKFDISGNPEPPTILLANRNGNILGQLDIDVESIDMSDRFNDISEFSFTLYKYADDKLTNLWDKVVDFKLVWCKEWDEWFEIKVELDEETETIKTVFCTQLEKAELSQLNLYNIEINTESDIEREDYKICILYDEDNADASILNRLLKDKAPHYSVVYVDSTIARIQRTFSFDGTSIDDAFQKVAEEIGCVFVYHSYLDEDRVLRRTISVYDLQQYCNSCGHRGEFTGVCPKCGGTNIKSGYGDDTLIFITSDELATNGIQLVTDTDSVKNCFKLEAGDDLMTATVRNCNPNGSDYIWYFSDSLKEDMSDELVDKLESYDESYRYCYDDYVSDIDTEILNEYNSLVDKYVIYNEDLQKIESPIMGYSNLMNAYYNTIDLSLYLKSGLMPSIEMSETTAEEQAALLTSSALSPVAVNNENIESVSLTTANSAVLSMAKIIVKSTYKVEVKTSTLSDDKVWEGNFIITNYSDEDDTVVSQTIKVEISNDTETFVKQKIDKMLNKDDTDDYSISGLFEKDYDDFCAELKKYALIPLKSFYEACDACLNILIDQGVGNKEEKPDLYEKLYEPYYNKSSAISAEIKIREDEISTIEGVWDKTNEETPELIVKGLQQYIEECRNEIQNALNFEKYLGEKLWLEFCAYRRENTYSNDNYISDGLNNAELFKRAREFYEVAENEIYKSAELQHSISTTLNNLLAIPKFKPLVDSFKVGNWIRIQVDGKIFKLRLLEYEIDFSNFNNISVEFSDVTKIKNGITDVENILSQASSMATSYSAIQRQASQGNDAQDTLEQWISNGLSSAMVQIQNNDSEDITFTKNGLLCRSYDDVTGIYSPEQLKLTHNIIAYTDNNWETVRQAIGKHEYVLYDKDTNEFVREIGYGMGADFVTAGIVSGSQIIGGDIYSDNYSVADGTGSYLNLRDGTFSFGGGSLRYEGGNLIISSPDIPTTETITEINEEYLKTTTVYASGLQVNAANIQEQLTAKQINTEGLIAENISGENLDGKTITGGELFIGDKENTYAEITSDGILNCNGANITGIINAESGGTIAGFTIGNSAIYNGTTSLTSTTAGVYLGTDGIRQYNSATANVTITNGILNANGASISGAITTNNITATGGKIANFTISDGFLYNGISIGTAKSCGISCGSSLSGSDDYIFWAGNGAFRVDIDGKLVASDVDITGGSMSIGGTFSVSNTGVLTCSGANINGVLTAGTGSSLGGFKTDNNSIYYGSWGSTPPNVFICTGSSTSYSLGGSPSVNGWCFGAGSNFGVTNAGAMYARAGKIGGWNIKDNYISTSYSDSSASPNYSRYVIRLADNGIVVECYGSGQSTTPLATFTKSWLSLVGIA